MKALSTLLAGIVVIMILAACSETVSTEASVSSPSGKLTVDVLLEPDGAIHYKLRHKEKPLILPSSLGFEFQDMPAIDSGLTILSSSESMVDESWELPWGEQTKVRSHYNELKLNLQERSAPGRKLDLIFRVFDDGVGFRYSFPEQDGFTEALIKEEKTEFNLTGDHLCWWTPGDWDIYEHLYNTTRFSKIDALSKRNNPNVAQTYIPENSVNTPFTLKTDDGLYLSFHEANLTDYAGITLKVDTETNEMVSSLVGGREEWKVKRTLPFETPWRMIQVAEEAGDLIDSRIILNLNEPNKLGDVSWIKPTKYIGIWWEMHLGLSTWGIVGGKHGATTKHTRELIDFAARNNIGSVLVEGWNKGWDEEIIFDKKEEKFDFITPYPDYDLESLVKYGRQKGVEIIMHHETFSAPRAYEKQLDTAFSLMNRLGIHAVKTGYVGSILPKGEYHHGQWMVNHYRKVLETAAKYEVAVNTHEPVMETGIRRTFPNAISSEGLRGQEFANYSIEGGNPPEHLTIVPFTRMLAGPIDYTPGIFKMDLRPYRNESKVNTTLSHQLALYVVLYSPVQMAADLLENYEGNPAFQFIRDVGVDWEISKTLNGEIGDYVTIVRKEKGTGNWFLGSVTDENARELNVSLDFLDPDQNWEATLYADSADAHWDTNPTAYKISKFSVNRDSSLTLKLSPGGGSAIMFSK